MSPAEAKPWDARPAPEAPPVFARLGRIARQTVTLAGATFREAVRMKAFAAPVVFAATAVAAGPFLPSDGTPAGAVRLAISVSLIMASVFGTFAAVMLPSLLAAREARDRTAYLVATKPVPRWCLFAGRVLGLSCVMAVMFAGMALLSWIFVRYAALREAARGEEARTEAAEVLRERARFFPEWETGGYRVPSAGPKEPVTLRPGERARWRFSLPPVHPSADRAGAGRHGFEGRVAFADGERPSGGVVVRVVDPGTGEANHLSLVPPTPTPHGRRPHSFFVPAEFVRYDSEDPHLPGEVDIEIENRTDAKLSLVKSPPVVVLAGSYTGIPPGGKYTWEFRLGGRSRRGPAFRLTAHRELNRPVRATLEFRGPGGIPVERQLLLGTRPQVTVEVPPELLAGEGFVTATLRNGEDSTVRIATRGALVFTPQAGTFAGALVRWALLETSKAILVVIVTCAAATFLTFPVPALVGGAVAVGGYLVSLVLKLAASAAGEPGAAALVLEFFLRLLLPELTRSSVSDRIAEGVFIPASFVAWCAAGLVLVRGGVIGLVGAWLAHRQEVGG